MSNFTALLDDLEKNISALLDMIPDTGHAFDAGNYRPSKAALQHDSKCIILALEAAYAKAAEGVAAND